MSFIINPYSFGFNPLSLSPALWLSDTGSDAGVWSDISGNGRNPTQADAAKQPAIVTAGLNGRQVRRFDGVNDYLQNIAHGLPIGSSPRTAFSVFKNTVGVKIAWLYGGGAVNQGYGHYSDSLKIGLARNGNDILSAQTNNFHCVTSVETGSQAVVYVNGSFVATGSSANTTGGPLDIGRYGVLNVLYFDSDIAEILVFPTALSTTNRQAVESYLRTKWGTP